MGFSIGKYLRGLDLFSTPFVFFVGDKKSKSTLIGGLLSFSILAVSFFYFYYLLNMYFSNQVEPKVTSSIVIENIENKILIDDNFFMMEMLIAGEPLKRYEKRVGKQYLSYKIYYEEFGSDGSIKLTTLPLVECEDSQFDGYLCVPSSSFKNEKHIYQYILNNTSSDYAILITPCDKNESSNCATDQEIYDLIFQPTNYFQLYTKISQYNTNERQYKTGYKQEYFMFDPSLIAFSRISLFKATTTVNEGLIIQQSEVTDTIFDYQRVDTYLTNDKTIQDRMGIYGYAYITFQINQVHNYIYVQHAMITEILAQFMSIFNSMLTIGIIARMLAEQHIVEDVNNLLLKDYYKMTALKLVKKQEGKQVQVKNSLKKNKIRDSSNNVKSKLEVFNQKLKQDQILELQNTICETNFSEKQNKYFQIGFWEKLKISIQSIGKNSETKSESQKNPDSIIYRNLIQQSMKRINIFEVYRDLVKLKMAIKLVLTKDQYAAIHFCGSDIISQQQQTSQNQINPNESVLSNNQDKKLSMTHSIQQEHQSQNQQSQKLVQNNMNGSIQYSFQEIQKNSSQIAINSPDKSQELMNNEKTFNQTPINNDQNQDINQQNIMNSLKQISISQKLTNNKNERSTNKRSSKGSRNQIHPQSSREDESILNNSQSPNEDISNNISQLIDQIEMSQEIKNKPNLQNMQSCAQTYNIRHLQEMDKIDEDILEREKMLQKFLDKMNNYDNSSNNNNNISEIDKQIYSSLIYNDLTQFNHSS